MIALVAHGPNDVCIPMMFWSDYGTALAHVAELLGKPNSDNYWIIWKEHFFDQEKKTYFFLGSEEDWEKAEAAAPEAPKTEWEIRSQALKDFLKARKVWCENLDLYLKKVDPIALFTNYYGGCGECSGFSLETYEEGKPCVSFNLD